MDMMRRHVFFVAALLLFTAVAAAASIPFGSVGHNQRFTMLPGETRSVELTFFNYGNTPLYVSVTTTGSDEIGTSVTPENFILQNRDVVDTPTGETKWVAFGDDYVKAVPVTVKLRVPSNPDRLSKTFHKVKVRATAQTQQSRQSGATQTVSQVREYNYHITIPGSVNPDQGSDTVETPDNFNPPPLESGEDGFQSNDDTATKNQQQDEEEQPESSTGTGETTQDDATGETLSGQQDTPTGMFIRDDTASSDLPWGIPATLLAGFTLLTYAAYRRYR